MFGMVFPVLCATYIILCLYILPILKTNALNYAKIIFYKFNKLSDLTHSSKYYIGYTFANSAGQF